MSAQETTSLETAIESQLTAPRAEPKGPAAPNFSPPAAPKPAKPAVTAETAPRPQNEKLASGKAAAADPAPASATAGKDTAEAPAAPNFGRLAFNLARLMEQGSRALAACFNPSRSGASTGVSDQLTDAYRVLSPITAHWLSDPARAFGAQASLAAKFLGLWANGLRRAG
jgi:polyhydroxyalkanoate synthase subunit PhaC